jgi:isoleucyl-tRNA synthetase
MFQPFEGTPNYPELERSILKLWDEQGTFDRLRAQTAEGEPWRFQDGPITANNPMGVHHAWGRTYKDIFQRFYAMNGRNLRWQNGFDARVCGLKSKLKKHSVSKASPIFSLMAWKTSRELAASASIILRKSSLNNRSV